MLKEETSDLPIAATICRKTSSIDDVETFVAEVLKIFVNKIVF